VKLSKSIQLKNHLTLLNSQLTWESFNNFKSAFKIGAKIISTEKNWLENGEAITYA
jgi:hypothetical protein